MSIRSTMHDLGLAPSFERIGHVDRWAPISVHEDDRSFTSLYARVENNIAYQLNVYVPVDHRPSDGFLELSAIANNVWHVLVSQSFPFPPRTNRQEIQIEIEKLREKVLRLERAILRAELEELESLLMEATL